MPDLVPTPRDRQHDGLEDALRGLTRESPYLGVSLLLHAIILVVFMSSKIEVEVVTPQAPISVGPPDAAPELPPEPPPPPPVEPPTTPIESPEINEVPILDVTDPVDVAALSDAPSDGPLDAVGADSVIGVGKGPAGDVGRPGGKYGGRKPGGAGTPFQPQVDAGLRWLALHQHPAGHWSAEGFEDECGKQGDTRCTGRGSVHHDVGVTGLALLAFLGAGHTDKDGAHAPTVRSGLRFLIDEAQDSATGSYSTGMVSSDVYDHMLSTLAVVEAYALTGRNVYRRSARRAIAHIEALHHPGRGWRYRELALADPDLTLHPDDVSVSGWALLALTMARDAGLEVDASVIDDGLLFLDEMTDAGGRTGYVEPGGWGSRPAGLEDAFPAEESEAMTAVAMLCRIFADPLQQRADLDNAGDIRRGAELLLARPIVWDEENQPGRIDFYYWYYASYALYQLGGPAWREWKDGIGAVARAQIVDDDAKGSWDPQVDVWGGEGGRVYSTAMLTLVLEVWSRYGSVLGSHEGPR